MAERDGFSVRFSILIAVYNVEQYLHECVESVLSQDMKDYEIIIIDDGSTDKSGQICDEYKEKYPEQITVVHKQNEGLLMARRDALKIAKGDYILFLDSDDYYEAGALKAISDVIDSDKPDVVIFNVDLVKEGEVVGKLTDFSVFGEKYIFEDKSLIYNNLLGREYNFTSLVMKCCKRDCVGIDTDYTAYKGLNYGEDLLQSIEIYTNAQKIVYISNATYCYRIGSGMSSKVSLKLYTDNKRVNEAFHKYIDVWDIENKEEKLARHLLYYVCDIVKSIDKAGRLQAEEKAHLEYMSDDEEFREKYEVLSKSCLYKEMKIQERLVLYLLYKKWLPILYLIIAMYIKLKVR